MQTGKGLRLAGALLVTGVLTAGLFATVSITDPGTAHARCLDDDGGRGPVTDYWAGGVRIAYERGFEGTCNGNSLYRAHLYDGTEDGFCVRVQFEDGGLPFDDVAINCRPAHQAEGFRYQDVNGNSHANMRFCKGLTGTSCGFGREPALPRGLNSGF